MLEMSTRLSLQRLCAGDLRFSGAGAELDCLAGAFVEGASVEYLFPEQVTVTAGKRAMCVCTFASRRVCISIRTRRRMSLLFRRLLDSRRDRSAA